MIVDLWNEIRCTPIERCTEFYPAELNPETNTRPQKIKMVSSNFCFDMGRTLAFGTGDRSKANGHTKRKEWLLGNAFHTNSLTSIPERNNLPLVNPCRARQFQLNPKAASFAPTVSPTPPILFTQLPNINVGNGAKGKKLVSTSEPLLPESSRIVSRSRSVFFARNNMT
jgi:hypothetical protein